MDKNENLIYYVFDGEDHYFVNSLDYDGEELILEKIFYIDDDGNKIDWFY